MKGGHLSSGPVVGVMGVSPDRLRHQHDRIRRSAKLRSGLSARYRDDVAAHGHQVSHGRESDAVQAHRGLAPVPIFADQGQLFLRTASNVTICGFTPVMFMCFGSVFRLVAVCLHTKAPSRAVIGEFSPRARRPIRRPPGWPKRSAGCWNLPPISGEKFKQGCRAGILR